MKKIFNVFLVALVLVGLMLATLPVDSADAGGCLYPEQVATGEYYIHSPQTEPNLYKMCQVFNPGTVPGYRLEGLFDKLGRLIAY